MHPLKVIMFTPSFLPFLGGMEIKVYETSRWLIKRGHRVCVMTIRRGDTQSHELMDGIEVFRFKLTGPFALPRLLQKMVTDGIDIVHVHWIWKTGLLAMLLSKAVSRRVVLGLAGSDIHNPTVPSSDISEAYMMVIRTADLLITTSEDLKEKALERRFPQPIVSIPQGIDLQNFHHEIQGREIRKTLGIGNAPLVLSVARLVPIKGLVQFIRTIPRVLNKIPDTKFVIVGDGPERKNLESEAELLKIRNSIFFTGRVPYQLMPKFYSAADLFVHVPIYDAMPHVVFEAMAMKKPVIVSTVGGITEIVKEGVDGIFTPLGNPAELSDKIIGLLLDRKRREEIGIRAYEKIKNQYTWDAIGRQLERHYYNLL